MTTEYPSGELGNPLPGGRQSGKVPPFFVAQQRARIYPRSFDPFGVDILRSMRRVSQSASPFGFGFGGRKELRYCAIDPGSRRRRRSRVYIIGSV